MKMCNKALCVLLPINKAYKNENAPNNKGNVPTKRCWRAFLLAMHFPMVFCVPMPRCDVSNHPHYSRFSLPLTLQKLMMWVRLRLHIHTTKTESHGENLGFTHTTKRESHG